MAAWTGPWAKAKIWRAATDAARTTPTGLPWTIRYRPHAWLVSQGAHVSSLRSLAPKPGCGAQRVCAVQAWPGCGVCHTHRAVVRVHGSEPMLHIQHLSSSWEPFIIYLCGQSQGVRGASTGMCPEDSMPLSGGSGPGPVPCGRSGARFLPRSPAGFPISAHSWPFHCGLQLWLRCTCTGVHGAAVDSTAVEWL